MPIIKENTNLKLITGLSIILAALFAVGGFWNYSQKISHQPRAVLNGQVISLEIAQTAEDKSRGLSGRNELVKGTGMIFVYDGYYQPKFWMKDMNFPIDIIWLRDNMVIGYEKSLPPAGNQPEITYRPPDFINAAIELPAGFIEENNVKIGDKAEINLFDKD